MGQADAVRTGAALDRGGGLCSDLMCRSSVIRTAALQKRGPRKPHPREGFDHGSEGDPPTTPHPQVFQPNPRTLRNPSELSVLFGPNATQIRLGLRQSQVLLSPLCAAAPTGSSSSGESISRPGGKGRRRRTRRRSHESERMKAALTG